MAKRIRFPEAKRRLSDNGEIEAGLNFPQASVTCWKLSQEELDTGVIWLVTDSFGALPRPPAGERWVPALYITGRKAEALTTARNWMTYAR